jgi:hypothetical protein
VDEPYIESIHFSKWSCPSGITDGVNPASGSNESTAAVSFEVDPKKREECAKATTDGLTFYNTRAACGKEIIGNDVTIGLEWEPNCIYVVTSTDNQAQLFDEMMVLDARFDPYSGLVLS